MFIFSRTAQLEDDRNIQLLANIQRYCEIAKNFTKESLPRYKFWEYSLVIELARRENKKNILDVGNGADITYDTLCKFHQLNLTQARPINLRRISTHNKFDIVTILGELEHINSIDSFLKRISRYLVPGSLLVITTDDITDDKFKVHKIGTEELLEISIKCEAYGLELYDDMRVSYREGGLHSLVLKRLAAYE